MMLVFPRPPFFVLDYCYSFLSFSLLFLSNTVFPSQYYGFTRCPSMYCFSLSSVSSPSSNSFLYNFKINAQEEFLLNYVKKDVHEIYS